MTKRVGNFNENNSKKFKTDSDLNHLWGDDLDSGDVEDCFYLASQVCEQDAVSCTQRNNVSILKPQNALNGCENEENFLCSQNEISILPSYNALKFNQKNLITSTQIHALSNLSKTNEPSHSSFKFPLNETAQTQFTKPKQNDECVNHQLQSAVVKLQNDCMAKEGEASILRSQLKQIRKTTEIEQTRMVQVWTDKVNEAQKDMEAVRSDLEFKNLEIANLRSKIIELTKHFNSEVSMSTAHPRESDQNLEHDKNKSNSAENQYKVEIILEYETLMTAVTLSAMFNSVKPETYQTSLKYNGKCNQYLEKEDHVIVSELRKINENKRFSLSCVYSDISALISCTAVEVDSEECYSNINKILRVTQQVVQNFRDYLLILESNMQNEDIEQADNLYLSGTFNHADSNLSPFDSREWIENEIGIKSRQMITMVSEILPFSSYLRNHLLDDQLLVNEADGDDFIHASGSTDTRQKFNFLHLILSTLNIIGNVRKGHSCVGFLSAVTLLLTNIYLSPSLNNNNCCSLVLSIARELVFARPTKEAIRYLSKFFKKVSSNEIFVQDLCKMPLQRSLKACNRDGILSFNKDSCLLQVYTTLYEDNFINRYDCADLDINLNTLQFMTNLLQSETLQIYFQETNYCDCILKINSLCMEIICETLTIYRNGSASNMYKCWAIFEYSLRILNILNFKFACLITVKPEYKFIIESFLDIKELVLKDMNLETLQNLNIQEDVPNISVASFDSIPFWK